MVTWNVQEPTWVELLIDPILRVVSRTNSQISDQPEELIWDEHTSLFLPEHQWRRKKFDEIFHFFDNLHVVRSLHDEDILETNVIKLLSAIFNTFVLILHVPL